MVSFDFPTQLQKRLNVLNARQFSSMAIHVGAFVDQAKAHEVNPRYEELKNAWILVGHPTDLPEAQPYFDWLGATITAVFHEKPLPPEPVKTAQPNGGTLPIGGYQGCWIHKHESQLERAFSILEQLETLHQKYVTCAHAPACKE